MRGLYVHVPFCRRKCHYCNYVIAAAAPARLKEDFFRAIEKEAEFQRARRGPLVFDTLYLGGGTPSALDGAEMSRLVSILRKHFGFCEGFEFTCEANPGEINAAKARVYRKLGVNRISLGAQSFDDALLADMGRIHDSAAIGATARMLREEGFGNISFDLIIRLPGQTPRGVVDSVRRAASEGASQMVIYDLNVHEGTVYGARRRRGTLELPPEERHFEMARAAEETLAESGYVQYEISSFARPGFESRHNLIYWHNAEYLGLGPGAFSYMEGCRYQYARDAARYVEKCLAGRWENDDEDFLSPEKTEMETLLTGLRLKEGVALRAFPLLGRRLESEAAALAGEGLIEEKGGRWALTRTGRHLAETVFTRLADPGLFAKPGGF